MRKKLTMLLTALFLVMGTAWAQVSYTVSMTTGTANKSGYFATWAYTTSDANPAALKLAVQGGANNMQIANEQLELWVGSGCTYTLQVPVFYRIVSYSFDFVKVSDYPDAVTLTVDGKEYNPTMETQSVTVNNINQSSTAFKLTGANKGIKVSNFVVNVDCAFEVTTDENNPIWHTIKNVRGNVYAYNDGDSRSIGLSNAVANGAYLFYFTAGTTAGTYKIHSYVTSKKCADFNSWTTDGIDWYIKPSDNTEKPGWAITKNADFSGGWNNAGGSNTHVAGYTGNDVGSTWEIARYDYESVLPTVLLSTAEKKVLHYIRSIRRDSYVNFDGHNVTFKEGNLGLASYWYFVQDEEAQKTAPAGFLACRIFNAAHATGVENYTSGFMGTDSWPARVYYIGMRANERHGYVIYRADETGNQGWHDYGGTHIGAYGMGDNGSLWRIYPADKTEEQLKSEAATAKTNALNTIAVYEEADYYSYSAEPIATAKTTINAVTNDNLLNATSGWMAINAAMATLESTEKGSTAPIAGDYIQLKNKHHNKYLKALESDAEGVDSKADMATIWEVVAGANGYVKLKNVSTEKYIGQVKQSATVAMTDEANAAEFSWTNQDKVYAVFKDVTGNNYAYGHVNGGKLVGWLPDAASSQWVVSQAYPLTVVYMYNGEEIAEHKVETYLSKGATYTIANPYANSKKYVTLGTCTATGSQPVEADGTWSVKVTEATSITVTIVDNLPFKVSKDFANANWQYLQMNSSNWKYMQKNENDNNTSSVGVSSLSDRALWAFVGDALNGFKILNKAAGERAVLTVDGVTNGTVAYMKADGDQKWTIEKGNGGFIIRQGAKECLNDYAGGGVMKIWDANASPTGAGSAFRTISVGVTDLADLCLPGIFTLQAERSPLLYDANAENPGKLSSGMANNIAANTDDVNQQFMIVESGTKGLYYLYSVGAAKFVDAELNFTDYPEPVLSFEPNAGNLVFPWFVKIGDKYVVPGSGGTEGNKIHHLESVNNDDGKRYRIEYVNEDMSLATAVSLIIQHADGLLKDASSLSNTAVYTVTTYDRGSWWYNSEQPDALWATNANPEDNSQQFAFLTVGGKTYLYSVGAGKFVVKGGENNNYTAYSDAPTQPVELLKAEGNKFFPFVVAFVDGENRYHIGISSTYDPPVITFWYDLADDGNKVDIREAGEFEGYEEVVATMESYLTASTLVPELEGLITRAEKALTYLLEGDKKTALEAAKTNAEGILTSVYNAETLGEQITALSAALNAAIIVDDYAKFTNNYVYSFVTSRGWVGADANSENLIGTANSKVDPAPTPSEDNTMFQWAVYKSENNHYYMYNIGKGKFMGVQSTNEQPIPFAKTPQSLNTTFKNIPGGVEYPIMLSPDNKGSVSQNANAGLFYWGSGWNRTDDAGNNHKVTVVGVITESTLATIAEAVELYEEICELGDDLADADNRLDDALGYYSCTAETQTELDAIEEFMATATDVAEVNAKTARVNELIATFTLNVPQVGKFYRIKNNAGNGYLSSGESGRTQFKADIATDASSIFGYIDGKLLSYKNGMYIHNDGGQLKYADNPGEEGIAIDFVSSLELGKLQIRYYTTENRYLYSGGTGNTDAGRDAENTTEARYRFTVEEVTTLPVYVSSVGYATLYAPVALEIPEGVVAYVGVKEDNYLTLTDIKEVVGKNVIPANTGVILESLFGEGEEKAAKTFSFTIATEDVAALDESKNLLIGKYPKSEKNAEKKVYTLQNGSNGVGLYLFKGEDANGKTYINGFRAWVELDATQSAQGLRIRKGGEGSTDIQDIDIEESAIIYDLLGRRIETIDKAGIYIMNGKKVVIR